MGRDMFASTKPSMVRTAACVFSAVLAASPALAADKVPPPSETPVEVIVSGRTSTLKSIKIVKTGQSVPPNFSNGRVRNTPGYTWYVSRHYAVKTDMPEKWARECLTWAELAYPHMIRVIGAEPDGIEGKRMVFVYGKTLASLRQATFTDGGFRWGQSGGGVTFDFLKAAYNYPSGSLRYHKRDLVIHENLHLMQACVTGSCYNVPFRFLEGITYAFANHVYDRNRKQLTVSVLDKPTVNNPYDTALGALAKEFRPIRKYLRDDGSGPLAGLYTQFMWTDPERLMKWRLWRDELFALAGANLKDNDERLMREIYDDLDRLNDEWKRWVSARRSTFHYVDWGWEQVGNALWSYGWPQKTPFSQTNINLPLGERAVFDPLRMDYPAEPLAAHIVAPVRRGGPEPAVGAVLDFSRNPDHGLCGLAFGVITGKRPKRPARLPQDAPGQINVYVQAGKTLVMDGTQLKLKKMEVPIPAAVRAGMRSDGHRVGLSARVAAKALEITLRAGPKGSVKAFNCSLPLTAMARKRMLARPSAVIAKDGYHGVTPFFDAARKMPPDLTRPGPPNRWRFAGDAATYRLYRAAWRLGKAAPGSLLALRDRMVSAMGQDAGTQRAAMDEHAAGFRRVVRDVRAVGDSRLAEAATAELLGVSLKLRLAEDASGRRPKLIARLRGPAEGRITAAVTFRAGPGGAAAPIELAAGPGQTADARWVAPPTTQPAAFRLHARAELDWSGLKLSLADSRVVFPSIPRWWVIGPFDNRGGERNDIAHPVEKGPARLGAEYTGRRRKKIRWRRCRRPSDLACGAEHVIDFNKLYGGTSAAAYALTWIDSDRATDALLAVGSDDGVVVWLDAARIHTNLAARAYRSMEDEVPLRLRKGRNRLLIKVTQGGGDWKFCGHLLDTQRNPLRGVRYVLDPGPTAEKGPRSLGGP